MDIYEKLVEKIVEEQEVIIGPLALEQAKKVDGLNVDLQRKEVKITGDKKTIVEQLVKKYEKLFGRASVEVCREAARTFVGKISPDQLPVVLQ